MWLLMGVSRKWEKDEFHSTAWGFLDNCAVFFDGFSNHFQNLTCELPAERENGSFAQYYSSVCSQFYVVYVAPSRYVIGFNVCSQKHFIASVSIYKTDICLRSLRGKKTLTLGNNRFFFAPNVKYWKAFKCQIRCVLAKAVGDFLKRNEKRKLNAKARFPDLQTKLQLFDFT